MKRVFVPSILLYLVVLAVCASVVGVGSASSLRASLTPIVLTPGSDVPISCAYPLTGSLNDPTCPAPTATPVAPIVKFTLPPYTQGEFVCSDGDTPISLGVSGGGSYTLCPAATNTPKPTSTAGPGTPTAAPTP